MSDFLNQFFRDDYMSHGFCYMWQPGILWVNVISDLAIALAYFSIPFALVLLVKKRGDLEFRGLFSLFAAFILFCGLTHLFAIYTIWHAEYGIHGLLKFMTALVSIITAICLYKALPNILRIPSSAQLEAAMHDAAYEKFLRNKLEIEKKAEAIFRFATELLPTGLLVIDGQKRIRLANRALEKMFRFERDEMKGRYLQELIPEAEIGHHNLLVDNFMQDPEQHHAMASGRIVRGRAKNGEEISLEVSLSVHEFENEKHAFASVVDMHTVISEKTLFLEHSNRIRRALDATNDGIWEWNTESGKAWINNSFSELLGVGDKENYTMDDWINHIHKEDRARVKEHVKDHHHGKCRFDIRYRGLTGQQRYEWFHIRGDTLFDKEKPLLMSGVISNINEKMLLEKELAESNKALEQFAYSASHDMQEPLRKISAFAGLLEEKIKPLTDDDEINYQLERIVDASNRMSHMIDSLLKLSRVTSSSIELEKHEFGHILEAVKSDLSEMIRETAADIRLEEDFMVYVDKNLFQQVIMNLLKNSMLYRQDNIDPVITISSYKSKGSLMIKMKDNGKGISKVHENLIFEPFKRLQTQGVNKGSGMGLSICRQIMKAHAGDIYLDESSDGAIFILVLPLVDNEYNEK